jgi:hypothetical protein
MKALRKQLPKGFKILSERPVKMDFDEYKEKRKTMNKVLKWYTSPRAKHAPYFNNSKLRLNTQN